MNEKTPCLTRPLVMIVDDEPENLHLLDQMLTREGYSIAAFPSARAALDSAREFPPFIALLDVRMPGMDGYTLCFRMKQDPELALIPVLFISAFEDRASRLAGFAAGGADYIAKPICEAEVLARVNVHTQLRHHREQLEQLVAQRTRDLAEAHRRLGIWDDCKTDWLNVLSHELRTPLTGTLGVTELLFDLTRGDPGIADLQDLYEQARSRIDKLISDAELLSAVQVGQEDFVSRVVDVGPVIRRAAEHVGRISGIPVRLDPVLPGSLPVCCDESLLERALTDLLHTAARCVNPPQSVKCTASASLGSVEIMVETDGRTLDEETLETFFAVGGQRTLLSPGGDWGLGPPVAQRILSLFHGHATARNRAPSGVCIRISVPMA